MRRMLLPVLILFGLLPLQADEYEYLWLHSPVASGTRSISLDDLRKITFGEKSMELYLNSNSKAVTWGYDNLLKMTFETNGVTAVESPSIASGLSISYSMSEVHVESPSPLKSVAIYNLQGIRFATFGQGENIVSYPLDALPSGIYIIRAENEGNIRTFKFVKC